MAVHNKFNIRLLSDRLKTITDWTKDSVQEVKDMPIGYFGASTGAAAAYGRRLWMNDYGTFNFA
jgi:hypothetical protein